MVPLLLAIQETGSSCPGCIVSSSPGVMDGMFWGLVFMMVTPFLVLAIFGGGLARAKRADLRAGAGRSSGEDSPHATDGAATGATGRPS